MLLSQVSYCLFIFFCLCLIVLAHCTQLILSLAVELNLDKNYNQAQSIT